MDNFINSNPPSSVNLIHVEKTFLSEFNRNSYQNIKLLDGLIGMCPMIGLLGTVYGMIEVFEVLSFLGTGNPRAMSSGVAKATIPTMASMVITLFGLYFRQDIGARLEKSNNEMNKKWIMKPRPDASVIIFMRRESPMMSTKTKANGPFGYTMTNNLPLLRPS